MINNDNLEKILMSAVNTLKFHLRGHCRQFVVRQADRLYLLRAPKYPLGIYRKYGLKAINIQSLTAVVKPNDLYFKFS